MASILSCIWVNLTNRSWKKNSEYEGFISSAPFLWDHEDQLQQVRWTFPHSSCLIRINTCCLLPIRPEGSSSLLVGQDLYKYLPFKLFSNYPIWACYFYPVGMQGRIYYLCTGILPLLILFLYIHMCTYLTSRMFDIYKKIKAHLNNTYVSIDHSGFQVSLV